MHQFSYKLTVGCCAALAIWGAHLAVPAYAQTPVPSQTPEGLDSVKAEITYLQASLSRYKKTGISATEKQSLLKQIAGLRAKIAGLKTSVQTPVAVAPAQLVQDFCFTFSLNQKLGDTGNNVVALEEALFREGLGRETTATGAYPETFTPALAARVQEYQKLKGFPVTGELDRITRGSLNLLFKCNPGSSVISVATANDRSVKPGDYVTVQWTTSGVAGVKKIELLPVSGAAPVVIYSAGIYELPLTTSSYTWKLSADLSGAYNVRITVGSATAVSKYRIIIVPDAVPAASAPPSTSAVPSKTTTVTQTPAPSPAATYSYSPPLSPAASASPSASATASPVYTKSPQATASPSSSPSY